MAWDAKRTGVAGELPFIDERDETRLNIYNYVNLTQGAANPKREAFRFWNADIPKVIPPPETRPIPETLEQWRKLDADRLRSVPESASIKSRVASCSLRRVTI